MYFFSPQEMGCRSWCTCPHCKNHHRYHYYHFSSYNTQNYVFIYKYSLFTGRLSIGYLKENRPKDFSRYLIRFRFSARCFIYTMLISRKMRSCLSQLTALELVYNWYISLFSWYTPPNRLRYIFLSRNFIIFWNYEFRTKYIFFEVF